MKLSWVINLSRRISVVGFSGKNGRLNTITNAKVGFRSYSNMASNRASCLFCRIADKKESNDIIFEDDEVVVFSDIRPATKYHYLIVTKQHIADAKSLKLEQLRLLDHIVTVGNDILKEKLTQDSTISDVNQVQKLFGFHWPPFHSVSHLHMHAIAPSDQMGLIGRIIFRPNSFWFVSPEYVKDRLEKLA